MGSTPIISTKIIVQPSGWTIIFCLDIVRGSRTPSAKPNIIGCLRSKRWAEPIDSHHLHQKIQVFGLGFFYPLRKQWYIITEGVYHQPSGCITSRITCIKCFHNDDIQGVALVIYNFFEIDDIHGSAVITNIEPKTILHSLCRCVIIYSIKFSECWLCQSNELKNTSNNLIWNIR